MCSSLGMCVAHRDVCCSLGMCVALRDVCSSLGMCVAYRDVCSSLVAHLAAVAVTQIRFPASCQILYKKSKTRDGVRKPGHKKSLIKKLNVLRMNYLQWLHRFQ